MVYYISVTVVDSYIMAIFIIRVGVTFLIAVVSCVLSVYYCLIVCSCI